MNKQNILVFFSNSLIIIQKKMIFVLKNIENMILQMKKVNQEIIRWVNLQHKQLMLVNLLNMIIFNYKMVK